MKLLSVGLGIIIQIVVLILSLFLFLIVSIVVLKHQTFDSFIFLLFFAIVVFFTNRHVLKFYEVYLSPGKLIIRNLFRKKEIFKDQYDHIERGILFSPNVYVIYLKKGEKIYFSINVKSFFSQSFTLNPDLSLKMLHREIKETLNNNVPAK